jgi:hypothetical protein
MYRIAPVGPADLPRWQAFVDSRPEAGAYHQAAWHTVLGECSGVGREYLWAADDAGGVRGVLPMYLTRSVFTGPQLATLEGAALGDSPDAEAALLAAARRRRDELGVPVLVVRGGRGEPAGERTRFVRPVVELEAGLDAVWGSFKANHRNHVRKALRDGLSVAREDAALAEFYPVYARRQRDLGTPVEPARLFDSMRARFGGRMRLHVARLDGRVVGGMLCVTSPASWWFLYGAADFGAAARYPNEALYWFTIQQAAAAGARALDLGTSAPGTGALRFKEKWTARREDVYYRSIPAPNHRVRAGAERFRQGGSLAQRAWSRLPVALANRLGPVLRRQLPFG